MKRPDAELIEAACLGDLTSFGELYERHYRLAVGIARSRLSDSHLAEDAAQEAFAIAFRTLSTLQDHDRFPQWLGTICRRTASRLAEARPVHEPLREGSESSSDFAQAALRGRVQDAVEQLDEVSREIVVLHYFTELSYEEISRMLDLSTQSVHGHLQRSRRKLAQILRVHDHSGAEKNESHAS